MKSALIFSLSSTVAAQPGWGWQWDGHRPHSTVAAPPAYTSGVSPSQAPSTAGLKNATVGVSRGGNSVCTDGYISVDAQAKNIKFNFPLPANESVVTDTFLKFATSGSPFLKQINEGMQTVGGAFSIRASLCTAKGNTSPNKVQLATHGIGFDRTYWDFAPGYSYVDSQTAAGWAVLTYDRLGVGESEKPDPIQVIQTQLEVEIAHTLATTLRNGGIANTKFSKVVGVGHSFGSIISSAITGLYPSTFDATILTGFSLNSSAIGAFTLGNNWDLANKNSPQRFGNLNNGFLVSSTVISTQIGFFRLPEFDAAVLTAADASKQTVTFGEYFTQGAVGGVASNYTRPLAVVNGDADLPFCSGNCSYPMNLAAAVKNSYPSVAANDFATYLAPSTGHGLNLHYTAKAAYSFIASFLSNHGL